MDGTYVGPDAAASVDAIARLVDQAADGRARPARSGGRRRG